MVDAVVGACWGDEGKGKFTDYFAGEARAVVRFQGGRNAGHTIVNEWGRFALHLLPSGVFRPEVVNLLGPGVALDVDGLQAELAALREGGVPEPTLRISDRAQVVLPVHPRLDRCEEERLGDARFGSTQVGIAPFYADKAMKLGIQVADLFDAERLQRRVAANLPAKNTLFERLYGVAPIDVDEVVTKLAAQAEFIAPFVCDSDVLIDELLRADEPILLEGQLGALRDPDHGVYPFSTSSSPLAGFGCVGAGVPPTAFRRITAIAKAYSSCVGATPFVAEIDGPDADTLRERGGEYGATTGRPRRIGWFDVVATRHGCRAQGATEVALSLLDVLGHLDEIPICTRYRVDGDEIDRFPPCAQLERAEPVCESVPGWGEDVSGARSWEALPGAAQAYVERIEREIGVPIRWVSVGPEREATIERRAA